MVSKMTAFKIYEWEDPPARNLAESVPVLPHKMVLPFLERSEWLFRHYFKSIMWINSHPHRVQEGHWTIRSLSFQLWGVHSYAVWVISDGQLVSPTKGQEARSLQRAAHSWLTGFCIKNKVTAPTKGASVRRGSRITRNVPYNCKHNGKAQC